MVTFLLPSGRKFSQQKAPKRVKMTTTDELPPQEPFYEPLPASRGERKSSRLSIIPSLLLANEVGRSAGCGGGGGGDSSTVPTIQERRRYFASKAIASHLSALEQVWRPTSALQSREALGLRASEAVVAGLQICER